MRHLDGLRHRIPAAAHHVVLRHFHDESALGGHHGECRIFRRNDARREPLPKDRVRGLQVCLPEVAVYAHQRVFAGHAVDHDIDALVGAHDAPKQRFNLVLVRVIDAKRDGRAAGGLDHRRGLVDRFGPACTETACL